MMEERGLSVSHTTIMRWVHNYSSIIDERLRKHLKQTNDSWRMDETYIKIMGKDAYLAEMAFFRKLLKRVLAGCSFVNLP